MSAQERRVFRTGEIRAVESGSKRTLRGYASVKDVTTLIGGARGFHEVIRGNAVFRDALAKSDVRFLYNHDANQLLARQSAGTLRLSEDARGLRYEVDLPNTQLAKDTFELVRVGALRDCSFAFTVGAGDDNFEDYDCEDGDECCGAKGSVLRTISRVDRLFDASLVVFPAYSGTSVAGTQVQDLSADPSDDDGDEDGDVWKQYSGAIVPAEVRSRAKAACRKPRLSDAEWLAAAQRKLAEIDGAWMANAQRRLSQAEQAIRVADSVVDLSLESQAARDLAFSEDVRITKRNARYLRHPHTFEGTATEYLEWLDAFLKG